MTYTEQEKSGHLLEGQKEVLERIVRGEPLDETLEALCQIVERQAGGDLIATVLLLDEDGVHLRAAAGKSAPAEYTAAINPLRIGPKVGSCGTAAYRGERVVVTDIQSDPLWADFRDFAAQFDLRACWSTPIMSSTGKVLGTFAIYYKQPGPPDPNDLRIVDVLTRTAGVSIERKRAEQALAQQNERLDLLWETAGVLLRTDEPGPMLHALFEKIRNSLALDVFFNYAISETGTSLKLISCAGIDSEMVEEMSQLEFGESVCGETAKRGELVVANEIQQSDQALLRRAREMGIRAALGFPLLVGDRLLGTLTFASRSRDRFEQEEIEFLDTICHYVAAAYERLDLIDQLREQDQRKDEFLAMLAHELRNPLAPIRSGLDLLAMESAGENGDIVGLMQQQVNHLVRLVDDLLDVSRIMQGKVELRWEPVELSDLVLRSVQALEPLIKERKHELRVSLPNQAVWLKADPVRLIQVIENLITNAAKYTDAGGQIEVAVQRHPGQAVVSVRDNGVGIEPGLLPKVFDLFTQSSRALDRSQGGLGIGLTLVQRLVAMHLGTVTAESQGIGFGSTFRVTLPTIEAPKDAAQSEPDDGQPAGTFRILVVDDNRAARHLLSKLLGKLGDHQIEVAADGSAALSVLDGFHPDIVLLDIGLPGKDGYQIAREIRRLPGMSDTLLIALTGYGQDDDRRKSREAGFDEHLVKPPSIDQMKQIHPPQAAG